jgi:excisionase family DNA binding protein
LVSVPSCGAGDIPTRLLYSPAEAGTLLGISHATLYRLIRDGRLTAVKIGSRTGITAASISRLCEEMEP